MRWETVDDEPRVEGSVRRALERGTVRAEPEWDYDGPGPTPRLSREQIRELRRVHARATLKVMVQERIFGTKWMFRGFLKFMIGWGLQGGLLSWLAFRIMDAVLPSDTDTKQIVARYYIIGLFSLIFGFATWASIRAVWKNVVRKPLGLAIMAITGRDLFRYSKLFVDQGRDMGHHG
jgi:hypothetical protein